MATTNHERVGKALELLKDGLQPFVEREMRTKYAQRWFEEVRQSVAPTQAHLFGGKDEPKWDVAALLAVIWNQWEQVFKQQLGKAHRSLVSELRDIRNDWAHQKPFSSDDSYRALDSAGRLLAAVSAPQAAEVEKLKNELLRLRYDEQVRSEKRKAAASALENAASANLKSWREVVTPHKDVASGRYQQAEFAADLWQAHLGEGPDEYRNPVEFFRRTFLTESLKRLLVGGVRRISGQGGDPVVQLQTNFGGGKTHSMLALYHLFSGTESRELPGLEVVMKEAGAATLPSVRRVVLVGNRLSSGNPLKKPDGTVVRTLWGELAWQLGEAAGGAKEARKAFGIIQADDEHATNPGDRLRELFNRYGPCLILIDEWVAYARQLHDQSDLPGGSFETQFSFAQALTESAKLASNCLLVVSLPASDSTGSPHIQADDVEVGGERGRAALDRLRNVIGRLESAWRPASAEEGFEIVRRRLFEPFTEPERFRDRDVTARAFAELYRSQAHEFPPKSREADYEARIKRAYPIHPEIFDRLYGDWSSLLKFQRTRGVLRLMAAVIHSLWEQGDRSPLILPAHIPIQDERVRFELTRYLPDNWMPVIEKDVDGLGSLPLRLDGEIPNLGKYSACRRVARTIYMGSAPTSAAAHRGIEDREVKLGCVMPGENPLIFSDALRRLAAAATYLYQDGPRYWYSTQPTVSKLAEDRAELLKRDLDKVRHEVERRLREDAAKRGEFRRVHVMPANSADVPDEPEARLIILGLDHPYAKETGNAAIAEAAAILERRGAAPRLCQNVLLFLAPDKARIQDLDDAVRKFLAWQSIWDERESLNLDPRQVRDAEARHKAADTTVAGRLPETYQWLLTPTQKSPHSPVEWEANKVASADSLGIGAGLKATSKGCDLLFKSYKSNLLRMEMDKIPLWRGDYVPIQQLVEDFSRYIYLPRLKSPELLLEAIRDGLCLISWEQDSFAYAESYDSATARYVALRAAAQIPITAGDSGLLVKPEIAKRQFEIEAKAVAAAGANVGSGLAPTSVSGIVPISGDQSGQAPPSLPQAATQPRRYHGSVQLEPTRAGRDAGRIADEVLTHLVGLVGSAVRVTLEIEAEVPGGVPDNVVRIVTENGRTLKFNGNSGFEKE